MDFGPKAAKAWREFLLLTLDLWRGRRWLLPCTQWAKKALWTHLSLSKVVLVVPVWPQLEEAKKRMQFIIETMHSASVLMTTEAIWRLGTLLLNLNRLWCHQLFAVDTWSSTISKHVDVCKAYHSLVSLSRFFERVVVCSCCWSSTSSSLSPAFFSVKGREQNGKSLVVEEEGMQLSGSIQLLDIESFIGGSVSSHSTQLRRLLAMLDQANQAR